MRAAIFDLDGTLADTSADLIAAANAALREAGVAALLDPAGDRATAFAGGRAMLRLGLERAVGRVDEAEVEAGYPRLLRHYAEAIDRETRLYPGVAAALEALVAEGWRLGVCTNKPEALARRLLDRLGLMDRFGALLGADSRAYRKPDPRHLLETIALLGGAPDRSVLIGDTVTDREAARAAGVRCVLVGFGPDGRAVAALGPEAVLDHYDELAALLARLFGPGGGPTQL